MDSENCLWPRRFVLGLGLKGLSSFNITGQGVGGCLDCASCGRTESRHLKVDTEQLGPQRDYPPVYKGFLIICSSDGNVLFSISQ